MSSSSSSESSSPSASGSSVRGTNAAMALEVESDGVARRPGQAKYKKAMEKKNIHISTREQYYNRQREIGKWALTQPRLKAYVKDGLLQKEGLEMMALHSEWFIAFINWLSFEDSEIQMQSERRTALVVLR